MTTTTIPTNYGNLDDKGITSLLTYLSYQQQRDEGCTHEALVSIGLGSDLFKSIYEQEKLN